MYKILIDTCVWLDLAKDPKQHPLIELVIDLINSREIEIIIPSTVFDEFKRNKSRIVKESSQSLISNVKRVREALEKFGTLENKDSAIQELDNFNYKIPRLAEAISGAIQNIDSIMKHAELAKISDPAKLRAADRAVNRIAPFHKGKNSMNDAIILECFFEVVKTENKGGTRFIFITHNKHDFSNPLNENEPHPDFSKMFSKIKCRYITKLSEALNKIRPDLVTESMIENEYFLEPRTFADLQKAETMLYEQVWFSRHQAAKQNYEPGILRESEKYAASIIAKHGHENLGPWTDFEWGMISGKLSAIRWTMGYEWDMLDS
jgi:hypothetical protein